MPGTVLHVTQPTEAGVAVCVANIARHEVERGWEVVVACPGHGDLAEWVVEAGARHVPWPASSRPSWRTVSEFTGLRRVIAEVDPAVVHLHGSTAGLVGRLVVRGRRPTLFQPHAWSFVAGQGMLRRLSLAWERFGARWSHRTICVSQSECRAGVEAGVDTTFEVVPNGVDLASYPAATADDRTAARRALALRDAPTVVCVGRLHRQKGQDLLLTIWAYVRGAVPGAQLVLIGDGPARDQLAARAPDGVVFAGARSDVARWLAASDLVAMPSRWEGMSLALLEAMASSRSLVVSDVAGMREALVEGPLPPGGAVVSGQGELADAIVARLRDADLATREGRAARQRVEASFDRDETMRTIGDLTESLAATGAMVTR